MDFIQYKQQSSPKLMYLDQNMWIFLAQVHYGLNEDPKLKKVYSSLISLVDRGVLRIVLNLTNLIETQKIIDEQRRNRLADFMIFLSKGYSYLPYVYIIKEELCNYIRLCIESPIIDLREQMVQIGFANMMGSCPLITSDKISEEDLDKANTQIKKSADSLQMLDLLLRQYVPDDEAQTKLYKNEAEDARKPIFALKDKTLRKKVPLAQWATTYLIPKIFDLLKELHIPEQYLQKFFPNFSDGQKFMTFLELFPLMYTNEMIIYKRDINPNRKIDDHDLYDISSLGFPIAYFDFVIGEKFFISLAKSAELDKKFGTRLFSKLEDLEDPLNQILEAMK